MKKTKGYYLRLWKNIGFIVIVLGAIIAFLCNEEYVGVIITLIGIVINIVPYMIGKVVYVCPKCKTLFRKTTDKIVLTTSNGATHWALLTCPKCKKTNFCKTKLVSKEEL